MSKITQSTANEAAVQTLNEAGALARESVEKAGKAVREQFGRASDCTRHYIQDEPIKAVLIAAAAGAAGAALIGWLSRGRGG